tara:strand:+ start:139 stop:525 length:387 start_codon:yes stop_codon:yes gene_type:complete
MRITEYTIQGRDIKNLPTILKKELHASTEYTAKGGNVFFMIFEHYSFLQNSNMSGSMLVDIEAKDKARVIAIVSGGKTSMLQLDIFGREKSLLRLMTKTLTKISEEHHWHLADHKERKPNWNKTNSFI